MTFLGSKDARNGFQIGFGGGEMEETELEEGEACSFENNEDYDASIDPDIALSYIDEKLQDVLGHFQKDFEGGVSAENLGAKFGGYGSFLPAYQRSPAWSHPKTPPKVHGYNTPKCSNNMQVEGGQGDHAVSSALSQSMRVGTDTVSSIPLQEAKTQATDDSLNHEVFKRATHTKTFTAKCESFNKISANISDQKTLKVRIKVGTDNLSTQKNAAIYSGLGLDISPSSSLDCSPSDSEGVSRDPQDDLFDSPTIILQIMTSFPVLTSPLPDDLIHLTEEALAKHSMSDIVSGDGRKVLGGEKIKSLVKEKYDFLVEFKGGNHEGVRNGLRFTSKESDLDTFNNEERLPKTSRVPIVSHPYADNGNSIHCESAISDQKHKEQLDLYTTEVNGFVEAAKGGSSRKSRGVKDNGSLNKSFAYMAEDNHWEGEKNCHLKVAEVSAAKGNRAPKAEMTVLSEMNCLVDTSYEERCTILPVSKDPFTGEKNKKGLETTVAEGKKEILMVDSPLVPESKKSSGMDSAAKNVFEDVKVWKDHGNAKDRYRAFFGELAEDDNGMNSLGKPCENMLIDSELDKKKHNAINCEIKERLGVKSLDKQSKSDLNPKAAMDVAQNTGEDSAPEIRSTLQGSGGTVNVGRTGSTVTHSDHCQNDSSHVTPTGNKNIGKEPSNLTNDDGSINFSTSAMKNMQLSVKSRSLNDVNRYPLSECDDEQKSSDYAGEREKNKRKVQGDYSNGGDVQNIQMESGRDLDQDCSRATKRSKADGEWVHDRIGSMRKTSHSSSSTLAITSSSKDQPNYKNKCSSKDSKYDLEHQAQVSVQKPKDRGFSSLDEGFLNMGKFDTRDAVKKQKLKEVPDAQNCLGSLHNTGHHLEERKVSVKEEFSEKECRKEKKSRTTKSEGKESSASKIRGKTGEESGLKRNQKLRHDHGSTSCQQRFDGVESLKRDLGSTQASVAATSSSSKVSGSHKTKVSVQELKGSPEESVSSSPVRNSYPDKEFIHASRSKLTDHDKDGLDNRGPGTLYIDKPQVANQSRIEDKPDYTKYCANGSHSSKSGKGCSSRLKDRNRSSKSENCKTNLLDKFGSNSDGSEKILLNESRRDDEFNNKGQDFQDVGVGAINKHDKVSAPSQILLLDSDGERSTKKFVNGKTDLSEHFSRGGKALPLPLPAGALNESLHQCPQLIAGSNRANGDITPDAPKMDDASKLQERHAKKVYHHQNGTQHNYPRHATPNGHRIKGLDAASPIRRDSSSHAANIAIREAKDLKHLADRLKNSGSIVESTGLYFQAALKFLHGASLLESSSNENTKQNELIQSTQVYSTTAKFCEFCAHEFERSKDMAAASLAYKCMEVAYMRVIYSSHSSANRDRQELQTALQMVPSGESPSSSASDVDNVNNSTAAEKVALTKGVSSPQIAGTSILAAQNRPNFSRLLSFTQDVNFAIEASRKSRVAFAAANSSSGEAKCADGISSIKRALDFSFHDVEGLLRLVRLAMDAINR